MANQAGTSSADSPEQKIKRKHSRMVVDLSKHFRPDLHHWAELLTLLSDVLEPGYLGGKDINFMTICEALMAKGTISYGSYDYLYKVISSIDVRPAEIIKKASDEIKDIRSRGPSQAKRPRTEEGDQTKDNVRKEVGAVRGEVGTVREEVGTVREEVGTVRGEVGAVREEVRTVRNEVGAVREEVGTVKNEVGAVREEVGTVREEVGTVREEVGAVREEVGTVKNEVETVREEVGTVRVEVGAVREEVGTVKNEVGTVREEVGTVRNEVRAVREEVGTVKNEVGAVREEVGTVRNEVGAVREEVGTVKNEVGAVREEVGTVKNEVGAVREEVGTVKNEVGAVREEVGTVRNEVGSVREDISIVNERLTLLSGNRERDPKLTAMIETTKSTVGDQTSRPEIISTQGFEDAKEVIRKNGMVIIKGASGDGKTMMCYQLLKWLMDGNNEDTGLSKDPLQLYSMSKWDDIVQPDSHIALFIDDVSGDIVEDLKRRKDSIQSAFCGKLNSRSNCLILNVRDEIFKSAQMSSCELFNDQNAIDLRGKNLITNEEKLEILQKHVPNIKDLSGGKETEIVELAPKIGFPQCCRLYRDVPNLKNEGLNFFKNPFCFMEKILKELPKECFASLLFLFLNEGSVKKGNLDPNGENIDKKKLDIAFHGIELSPEDKIRSLRRCLDEMLGSLLAKTKYISLYDDDDDDDDDDDVSDDDDIFYKFSHDSVQDTVVLFYGNDTKIGFIENCPRKYLRCISTSKNIANRIVISPSNQHMYKRLLREFESVYSGPERYWFNRRYSKYHSITSLDVWTDIQFLQGFIRWLSGQNVDKNLCHKIKLALLNGACSSGSEECALFLLSEGVKPDEETPFYVVKGGSVSVLRQLLEYDVTRTARLDWSQSRYDAVNINVLQEACLFEREEMVTILCNTYPNLVHDTDGWGRSTLHLVAKTGNCDIFKTVEIIILKSLYRVEDEQHKCERVEGRVVHRSCVCAQYMCQLLNKYTGETVLHVSCRYSNIDVVKYLCESYPKLATAESNTGRTVLPTTICLPTAVTNFGWHCLHFIARHSSDVNLFTECESVVKQYIISTGGKYDITTILTSQGESVLDLAKERAKYMIENPMYDYLVRLFDQQKQ